ncbi:MAG: hypothetical protein JRI23_29915 [Deltaproteobacteria bacterium]|nr:hypothetical protein [Deltaproteobacteria bacterium]MBW2536367.1 hypothetical protein [Deltaproteobacteria bacterium]
MASDASRTASPAVAGPLGTLALSVIQPHASTATLRAVKWHQDLRQLGIELPFSVVHDFGMLLSTGPGQLRLGPRCDLQKVAQAGGADLGSMQAYQALVDEARQSEAARQAPELKMSDDLVVVVLARVLGDVGRRLRRRPAYTASLPLDASLFETLRDAALLRLFAAVDRTFEREALDALVRDRLLVLTLLDALDLDTLRLFGMLGSSRQGALAQVELLASLETPEANDVVNFSLEILPSVLESKAPQVAGTMAAFGYSGLGRRGSIDNLVLTELSWDDLELARRILDNEVLYYAREQSREEQGRMHHLLIDGSASMRGDRATFARAMALATGKKLLLEGEDVSFRFFDSRLYEPYTAHQGELPTAQLLSFKGERGRNPARVFEDLCTVLDMVRQRDPRPQIVHVFTHAALYIPRRLVESVRSAAQIACVFMLPSGGKLNLDYLDVLNTHWVVDHAALQKRQQRAAAARSILEQVGPTLPESAA